MPMSPEVKKQRIVAREIANKLSEQRVRNHGGYHDEFILADVDGVPSIIIASLDPGKDYNAPDLTVCSLPKFIAENDWVLEGAEA